MRLEYGPHGPRLVSEAGQPGPARLACLCANKAALVGLLRATPGTPGAAR